MTEIMFCGTPKRAKSTICDFWHPYYCCTRYLDQCCTVPTLDCSTGASKASEKDSLLRTKRTVVYPRKLQGWRQFRVPDSAYGWIIRGANAGRDGRTCLARQNSQARTEDREIFDFPVRLTTSRIGNLTGLSPARCLIYVTTTDT